jgi:ribosomal protein S18 acetylase RimI-like enzyme
VRLSERIDIRVAGADDAEHVTRLMLLFRDWWDRDWPQPDSWRRGVELLLGDERTDFLLAAMDAQPPSGVAVLRYRHSLWQDAPDCWLEDLYVEEGSRRYGMGERLVSAALERARERGCRRVELDVNEANEPAKALYEKLGFSSFSSEMGGHNLLMRHHFERRA